MEFQVVLLAGGSGSRMYPLTEDIPKSLLPIANRPLISYQLQLLQDSGFKEVIVITDHESGPKVKWHIGEMYSGAMRIDIVVLPEREELVGTADALRFIKDKIKTDFFVISGDLISDVTIHTLADIHRREDATVTVLLKETPSIGEEDEEELNGGVSGVDGKGGSKGGSKGSGKSGGKGGKNGKGSNNNKGKGDNGTGASTYDARAYGLLDYIGLDANKHRLLYYSARADLDDTLPVSRRLLSRYPNMTIYTNLMDAHLYLFDRWVLEVLELKPKFSSIKGELLPYLVKRQFRRKKISALSRPGSVSIDRSALSSDMLGLGLGLSPGSTAATSPELKTMTVHNGLRTDGLSTTSSLPVSGDRSTSLITSGSSSRSELVDGVNSSTDALMKGLDSKAAAEAAIDTLIARRAGDKTQSLAFSMSQATYNPHDKIRCFAATTRTCYLARANTIPAYTEMNREIARGLAAPFYPLEPHSKGKWVDPGAVIDVKTTIGPECVIGDSVSWAERGSAKKSTVGAHCHIGKGVKITNSIIMDHVTIEDDVSLVNTIVCSNACVQSKSKLRDTVVGFKYNVGKDTDVRNEVFVRETAL